MPSGVLGPVLFPPCILHRPFFIAGDLHDEPLRVLATQRGALRKSPEGFPFFNLPLFISTYIILALFCMSTTAVHGVLPHVFILSAPSPLESTFPTMACPPSFTSTRSTVTLWCTVCPLILYRTSICLVNKDKSRSALCVLMLITSIG